MKDARSANRLRIAALLALSAALACGSVLWLVDVMRHGIGGAGSDNARNEPDYTVENFNFVRASKIGQARYSVTGVKLLHFLKDDTFQIDLPVMRSLNPEKPTITTHAQRALSNGDGSDVQLFDDVQVDRPESKFAPHFHMTTEYLQVFPDEDIMRTDRAVDIIQGNAEITGEVLYANDATLLYTLDRNVHTMVHPKKH
jgi:lipopolysaccharide export system protein LptC